jgi:lipoate-protein ligase A
MKYLDLTLDTPEENLACDEALLDLCEREGSGGVLRVFEAGYGNRLEAEVDCAACAAAGVPVLRRISGGGTVVLGPGCLGYALVLRMKDDPSLETVTGANQSIMERLREAMERVSSKPVRVRGITDLAVGDRKFAGNAQRRRQEYLLFHGVLLLDFDLSLIAKLLRMPSVAPEYREGRGHLDFVMNLGVPSKLVKKALREAWGAEASWDIPCEGRVRELMEERYARPEWHARR